MKSRYQAASKVLLVFLLAAPAVGYSQDGQSANVHWAYSAYFGTGWYQVSGDRDVFVVRLSNTWEFTEPSFDGGERRLGWYLRTPISFGLDRFDADNIPDAVDLDNVSFLSFNPTLDVEVPVNEIWSLRPYVSVGYGKELKSGGESAVSYWAGVKSRVALHEGERASWYLINKLGYVGYTPKSGDSDSFWPAMAGLEVNHPLGQRSESGTQWLLHWNASYTYFGNDIFFSRNPEVNQEISDQWEIGAAIGRRDDPVKIWFLEFDRLGLGLRTSSSGDLQGITFIFRSAFEK